MSTSTWTGAVSSNWDDAGNWSPTGVPGAGSDVTIASGTPLAVASASIGTVNSITDSSYLSFESAGTNAVATFLDDAGHLYVEGGTTLNIGETLTNSDYLSIGNATLSAPDTVTAASLDNTGKIYLTGSSADQALLDVAGSAGFGAAGVLSGYVRLAGDSAIEFASGEITSLAAGSHLGLVGSDAFIEDGTALGSNSALTGLASIGAGALFALHDGAAVSTTGALANDGQVYIDTGGGDGGSSLTLAGALTNSRYFYLGNATLSASDKVTAASLDNTGSINLTGSSANQALLDVTGSAGFGTAGVLSGNVELSGDSAIEFASGQITSLAGSAQLYLNGNDAVIEDSTALGSNSALTGLASIGAGATFALDSIAGDGGSSLTLAGALTNSGTLTIGNTSLSASDEVTAASLDNTGSINLTGSSANQALLDVTAGSAGFGTAGVLSGNVELSGDSAIEFASGEITSLANGASLLLNGSDALVEDSTAPGPNSALTGLASIGSGATFALDGDAGSGGSSLTLAGALTNSGTLVIGNTALSASDKVAATALTNTGTIQLIGSSGANQALLDVSGSAGFGAAGVLSGNVTLGVDSDGLNNTVSGDSAIEFGSGEIASLAADAQLHLNGSDAFVEDGTALGSNSALTGLASIGAGATFDLEDQVAVSTTGSLANDGSLEIDARNSVSGSSLTVAGALTNSGFLGIDNYYGGGGSTLSIGGALTNTGTLDAGNYAGGPDTVTAASLDNTGAIGLTDDESLPTLLDVTAGSAGFGTAGVLSGDVQLSRDSAIEFASGQITTIAAGATLNLSGNTAFIEDSTALGSNSALTGLADVAGSLSLASGASLSTTGGALTNTGSIDLFVALLDVTAGSAGFGVAGVLSGNVVLQHGAIEFASGQITSLANGAQLTLGGNDAFIEDSTALGSNSALTGLASIGAGATLNLESGAPVSTTGALANDGTVEVDVGYARGSSLTVAGALTNSGTFAIGNTVLSAPDKVAATALTNTGTIHLTGDAYGNNNFAALDVSGATTNNGSISIATDSETLAGAVGGTGSFSPSKANLQFDSSVSAGQTITETGKDKITLEQAQSFAATISGFGTGDTIDATNFLETATSYNFVENIAGTRGTLTLTDTSPSLTANIQMTGDYSNSSFTLAHDSGTGTLVKFI